MAKRPFNKKERIILAILIAIIMFNFVIIALDINITLF